MMEHHFLDKQEIIRLLLISVVAGEHMLLVGPPGTAKSALVRLFARLIDATLLRVPAHPLHRAQRALRPGRHPRLPRGHLHAPHRDHAARGGDRLPRRDLQVELGDPELAAHHPQRAHVRQRRAGDAGAALVAVRRLERGAQRREPGGDLRPLPAARRLATTSTAITSTTSSRRGSPTRSAEITGASRTDPARSSRRASCTSLHRRFDKHLGSPRTSSPSTRGWSSRSAREGISLSDRRVVKLLKLFAACAIVDGRERGQRLRLLHPQAHLEQPRPGRDPRGDRRPRSSTATTATTRRSGASPPAQAGLDEIAAPS